MKRIFAFFVVLLFCCSLCACGKLNISGEGLGLNVEGLKPNTENTDAGVTGSDEGTDKGTEGSGADLEVPGSRIEGPGYSSPEEAILAYAAALKTADISKILSTFAIETYVENFSLEEYINCYRTLSFSNMPLESWSGLTGDFALINRKNQIAEMLTYTCYTACLGYDYVMENWSIFVKSPEVTDQILDQISGKGWEQMLAKMEYSTSFIYGADIRNNEAFALAMQKTAASFGCDEVVPIAIRITLNGTRYYLCADVARYGDKWYNLHGGSYMKNCFSSDTSIFTGSIIPVE